MSAITLFQQAASPGTPAAGQINLWAGTDDRIKWTDEAGTVHTLTEGGTNELFSKINLYGAAPVMNVVGSTGNAYRGINFAQDVGGGSGSDGTLFGSITANYSTGIIRYGAGEGVYAGAHTFYSGTTPAATITGNTILLGTSTVATPVLSIDGTDASSKLIKFRSNGVGKLDFYLEAVSHDFCLDTVAVNAMRVTQSTGSVRFANGINNTNIGASTPGTLAATTGSFTGAVSIGSAGANGPVRIGKESASAYVAISLNNTLDFASMAGLIGSTGDVNTYYQVPTGGIHTFRVNGANTRATIDNTALSIGIGSASGTPFLKAATWDAMSWAGTTLNIGGLTAAQWTGLSFFTGGAERGTITANGAAKFSTTGVYDSVSNVRHEFYSNQANQVLLMTNSHPTNAFGQYIYYANHNANGTSNPFLRCEVATGGIKLQLMDNGGVHNYSANNVNLSDEVMKPVIKNMPDFWDEWAKIDWNRNMLQGQTHNDWNYGYGARQLHKIFGRKAPGLVTMFDDEHVGVHEHDLYNIGFSVLSQAVKRIKRLEKILTQAPFNVTLPPL